ncbi:MAG: HD domain-containing protein [Balneolaceae bacterium]|nr:HD domain-containing protein [Balneolaceae bacterium]MCH8548356.1 HD domain-containing protein [Balneolaceae bacterium]
MITFSEAESLLEKYIESESLRGHSRMVAMAMEAYAAELNKSDDESLEWKLAGLLHDLDWEKFPEEHPRKAVDEILPANGISKEVIGAIEAHAPDRTGREPESEIERYLFACDEISGFMNAVSLMRPNRFSDMKVKSVRKKLKDKRFAENVPREDINKGAELIDKDLSEHISFLIEVFRDL